MSRRVNQVTDDADRHGADGLAWIGLPPRLTTRSATTDHRRLCESLISDPRRCKFDPLALVCSTSDTAHCLTAVQAAEAKRFLSPSRSPRTHRLIFPALEWGSEPGWAFATGLRPPPSVGPLRYVLLNDPNWDWRTLDLDRDISHAASSIELHRTNPLDPDIRAFVRRGEKLLLHHGWSDAANAPQSTVTYYERVQKTVGGSAASSVRLFMAPGEGHCGGGYGPGLSNLQAAPGPAGRDTASR